MRIAPNTSMVGAGLIALARVTTVGQDTPKMEESSAMSLMSRTESSRTTTLLLVQPYMSQIRFHGVSFLLAVISCFNPTIQTTV